MNFAEAKAAEETLKGMEDPDFKAYAIAKKRDPMLFPLIFQEGLRRAALSRQDVLNRAATGAKPAVNDQALMAMQSRALPEESGIAQLPAGNMEYADGGIVAFAGGGKSGADDYEQMIRDEAARQGVDPEHMLRLVQAESGFDPNVVSPKKAAGLFQLMPDTAKDMGITEQERFNPSKAVPAGTRYFKQLLDKFGGDYEKATAAYNWGPNRQAFAKDDWKLGLPKETAAYLTKIMPMGSAQAAPVQQAAPADAPSIYTGPGYTPEGLESLGQRLDVIREARSKAKPPTLRERQADPEAAKRYQALQDLNLGAQREYEKYAENIYNKPAFAASAAGGKGVGTTVLPAAQAVAKEAAASDIAAQKARTTTPEPYAGTLRSGIEATDKAGAAGFDQPPEGTSTADIISAAKAAVPEGTNTKGWTSEDWLTLGFGLLSSESPYFMNALGKAGLGVLERQQAMAKADIERRKAEQEIALGKAHEKYYGAGAQRMALEDKPLAQYTKAVDKAIQDMAAKNPMYESLKPAEKAALEQDVRARVARTYIQAYPELADTILGKTGNPLVDKYLS